MKGLLITFEGIECSGKGTQIVLLKDYLTFKKKIRFVTGREPGGTSYGEAIRALLKNPKIVMSSIFHALETNQDYPAFGNLVRAMRESDFDLSRQPECEMFLFMASRAEHAQKVIRPVLERGVWFIADRLLDSSVAYQGGGRHHSDPKKIAEIDAMNRIAMDGIVPSLTLYLDIPIEVMYKRMAKESPDKNSFFEQNYRHDFFVRTREEYLHIAEREPNRFKIVDGTKPADEVAKDINKLVDALGV
jgi:dTMP kinase